MISLVLNIKLNIVVLPLTTRGFRKEYLNPAIYFHKIPANWGAKHEYLKQSQKENRKIIIADKHFKIISAFRNFSKINGYLTKEIKGNHLLCVKEKPLVRQLKRE